MHKRNRLFITLALLYGLIGGLIGIGSLLDPGLLPGNVAALHGHIMLLGFIAMMIYGVGLHVLPRFAGRPLYSERLANWQLYVANLGLWLMCAGWLALRNATLVAGGTLSWLAIGFFTVNVLATVRHYGPGG
jgi:cbb3-type cytochrome oxidase subunit 1